MFSRNVTNKQTNKQTVKNKDRHKFINTRDRKQFVAVAAT